MFMAEAMIMSNVYSIFGISFVQSRWVWPTLAIATVAKIFLQPCDPVRGSIYFLLALLIK
jgi:hypothetical protein